VTMRWSMAYPIHKNFDALLLRPRIRT